MPTLTGRTIALPESRELELLARMLEAEGASIVRCPLVAILDAEDPGPVQAWIEALIRGEFDDVVLYTGEGVSRLVERAREAGLLDDFTTSLAKTRRFTRGQKPVVALRNVGLESDVRVQPPTTDGMIATLGALELRGHTVGVQLYGTEPNERLMSCLRDAGALPRPVFPYRYATHSEDARVEALIDGLGAIDLVAFTSTAQVDRLWAIAADSKKIAALENGLAASRVAAIGPVVSQSLRARGVRVDAEPDRGFTLKPLVKAIRDVLAP